MIQDWIQSSSGVGSFSSLKKYRIKNSVIKKEQTFKGTTIYKTHQSQKGSGGKNDSSLIQGSLPGLGRSTQCYHNKKLQREKAAVVARATEISRSQHF